MKRVCTSIFAVLFVLCFATAGFGDTFTYAFAGPPGILGGADEVAGASYDMTLFHDNPEGNELASGWSFSAIADGATITGISTDGTAAADAEFDQTSLALAAGSVGECEGSDAVVSAIVLALIDDVTLPAEATHVMAILDVEATIPAGGGSATLRFVNGCSGAGQPVDSVVTQGGNSADPVREDFTINLVEVVCACDDLVGIAFSGSNVPAGSSIWVDAVGVGTVDPDNPCGNPDENCAASGILELPGSSGTVYVNLISQIPVDQEQLGGWSLSIKFDDLGTGSTLTAVTTDGTAAADAEFDQSEVVSPEENDGMQGCTSAIVLALIDDVVLPSGQATVLGMDFDGGTNGNGSGAGEGETPPSASVFPLDGLRGSGQPVDNVATLGGNSVGYGNADTAQASLVLGAGPPDFIRGNANDDLKIDIADCIWTINFLFKEGDAPPCMDAADANDNGIIDLGDAQFVIVYLFPSAASAFGTDTMPPSAPFPACGPDPSDVEGDGDGLGCDSSSDCD